MPSQQADAKVTVGSNAAENQRRSSQPSGSGDAQSKLGRIATVQQSLAPEDKAVEVLKGEAKSAKVHPIIATEETENGVCSKPSRAGNHARVQALPAREETQKADTAWLLGDVKDISDKLGGRQLQTGCAVHEAEPSLNQAGIWHLSALASHRAQWVLFMGGEGGRGAAASTTSLGGPVRAMACSHRVVAAGP